MWTMILCGITLLAAGWLMFFRPGLVWKWTEKWKTNRAEEMSEDYRISSKVSGVFFLLCGVVAFVVAFVLK